MDLAIMKVGRESPHPITAAELQRQYGSWIPRGIRFTCPNCGQPVKPCAMSRSGAQSPHFRHKQNNEIAQQCDLYASGAGGYFGWEYQRVPMPMFIHRLPKSHDRFVVEGGFRAIDRLTLQVLAKAHAQIKMGLKRYDVSERRFGAGLTRLPFEDISLTPSANVQLVNSPIRFEAIWNPPEDASRAMVFSCDRETLQGQRVRARETVAPGSGLLILAPMREEAAITKAFLGARRVGFAGSILGATKLQVFQARLSMEGRRLEEEAEYLRSCGIFVGDPDVVPELLWPPSLTGDGEIRPLFEGSGCVFGVDTAWTGGTVFISDDPAYVGVTSPRKLLPSDNGGRGYLILDPSKTTRLLLTAPGSPNGAVLVDASSSDAISSLTAQDWNATVVDSGGGAIQVVAPAPVSVMWLRKGHAWESRELKAEAGAFTLESSPSDLVRVVRRLLNSPWLLTTWERVPERAVVPASPNQSAGDGPLEARGHLLESLMPSDKRLARARASGLPYSDSFPYDRELALTRSAKR